MKRFGLAVAINILIPGTGLIILRREWLGLALAILFAVLAQILIFGLLIVPMDMPRWAEIVAVLGLAGVWFLAQWLVVVRGRLVSSPELERELCDLRDRSREAMSRGDLGEAHRSLLVALSVNDEDVECAVLWAQLMGVLGRRREARKWWKRVIHLDRTKSHRHAAERALAEL